MAEDTAYGFGQGEGVLTVVQKVPLAAPVVEDVPTYDPLANHPQREETPDIPDGFVEDVKPVAAMGPVGPDPAQEAAKAVPVTKPARRKKA